ncbi:MAG: hypothetical protein J5604_06650 [Bacteroidales bacterium]|nr:hypothetical protein [Bacteroidales bacterium]
MKDNLIPIAYDENRNIVLAKEAIKEKGKKYFCPECGKELIYKNSGKTGPKTRRPHFAHKGDGEHNCSSESVLHSVFKEKTADILKQKIEKKEPFNIEWICKECNKTQKGNLLFLAKQVKVEHDMGICKPDIALLDEKGKVLFAIEIVNTHEPENKVVEFYNENGIILVQYNIVEEDLKDINQKLINPNLVYFCNNSKCIAFSSVSEYEYLEKPTICPQCKSNIVIFFVRSFSYFGPSPLRGITESELHFLETKYKLSRNHFTKCTYNNYGIPINTYCTICSCNRFRISLRLSVPHKRRTPL